MRIYSGRIRFVCLFKYVVLSDRQSRTARPRLGPFCDGVSWNWYHFWWGFIVDFISLRYISDSNQNVRLNSAREL